MSEAIQKQLEDNLNSSSETLPQGKTRIGPISLGVLASGWTWGIYKPSATLRYMRSFAQDIETLGYSRIWVTELHSPDIAWACPSVLMGVLAQVTQSIKIGAGAVLLPAHNPLQVALEYKTLAALFPGRIDLGIGGAMAGINHQALIEQTQITPEELRATYLRKTQELVQLLRGTKYTEGYLANCMVLPQGLELPSIWMLGGGGTSMQLASDLGLHYSHGIFTLMAPENEFQRFAFKNSLVTKHNNPFRQSNVAVSVVCADSEQEAQKYYNENISRAPEELKARGLANIPAIIGDPHQCLAGLEQVQKDYGVSEIIVRSLIMDPIARLKGFELLSEICHLPVQQQPEEMNPSEHKAS